MCMFPSCCFRQRYVVQGHVNGVPNKTGTQSSSSVLQQLYTDTGCSLEGLPEATDDRDEWRERVREIRASSTT